MIVNEQTRTPSYRPALWKIVAAALAGLLIGVLVAVQVTSAPPRYRATSTLALLPGPKLAAAELPDYWEVLSRGQATRTSALVLGQPRWLAAAAIDSGEPAAALTLAAGAIPDTSLISATMEADTSKGAELALRSVIQSASAEAAGVSGPFALNIVSSPEGSAVSLAPDEAPVLVAGGLAGLLLGAGLGLVAERAMTARRQRRRGAAADPDPAVASPGRQSGPEPAGSAAESVTESTAPMPARAGVEAPQTARIPVVSNSPATSGTRNGLRPATRGAGPVHTSRSTGSTGSTGSRGELDLPRPRPRPAAAAVSAGDQVDNHPVSTRDYERF
jgi:hypothetical protein